jgi:hypothetical protein
MLTNKKKEGRLTGLVTCCVGHVLKERRGKGRRQLLNDLKETTRYWKPKAESLHRTLCKTRFGSVYVPVLRQATGRMILGFQCFVV